MHKKGQSKCVSVNMSVTWRVLAQNHMCMSNRAANQQQCCNNPVSRLGQLCRSLNTRLCDGWLAGRMTFGDTHSYKDSSPNVSFTFLLLLSLQWVVFLLSSRKMFVHLPIKASLQISKLSIVCWSLVFAISFMRAFASGNTYCVRPHTHTHISAELSLFRKEKKSKRKTKTKRKNVCI